jgi:cyclophilin family peptidyl-prolyl cis-trans isomerase
MSKRSRERKLKKIEEQKAVKAELRDRYLMQTADVRKWVRAIGLMIAGLVVTAGLIFGAVKGISSIDPQVAGPFGSIARKELVEDKFATLETSQGNIKIELDAKATPKTVANFVLLAKKNFYDGIKFHRIVKDFMIQTGDPNSKDADPSNDGTGGPGYQFDDEKITGTYTRGTVAMANSGANTNGSQFFIMHKDNTSMPKSYVIFGRVVEGMDVVDKIAALPVMDNGQGEVSRPKDAPVINKVTLSAN